MEIWIGVACAGWGLAVFFAVVCWWLRGEWRGAESRLRERERQYFFLLGELPDPEPWQLERVERAARHKAAAAQGYHYDTAGRDGTEA